MSARPPVRGAGDRGRQSGLSYVEVLVSIVVIAAALTPALEALRNGAAAAGTVAGRTIDRERLASRLEEVAARRFALLDEAAGQTGDDPAVNSPLFSDPAGTADRIVVRLYRYDGAAATSANTGLLRVDVAVEGSTQSLSTLRLR